MNPFPPSASAPGTGDLVVQLLPHQISGLSRITFQYPLKLISPSPSASQKSVLVFFLTYGGGLVGGDQVHLTINVKENSKLSIATQGHTKIFKSPSRDVVTRQQLDATIKDGAALCLLPDPVQPFEGSVYEQRQKFLVSEHGSLCLLDWVTAGRSARGEDWDFTAWRGCNEIWLASQSGSKDRILLRDNIILEGDVHNPQDKAVRDKMQKMGIFGTLVLRGPLVNNLANFFLQEFAALPRIGARDFRSQDRISQDNGLSLSRELIWRHSRLEQEKAAGLLWSAAKVRGCTVIKFGAHHVEGGRMWVASMLKAEGSISRIFGDESTICVR